MIASYTAPEFDKSALVTIDVQRDVLEGQPLEVPGSSVAADAIGRLAEGFRAAGLPIVHIVRLYKRDGTNVDPCRRQLVERGAAMLVRIRACNGPAPRPTHAARLGRSPGRR